MNRLLIYAGVVLAALAARIFLDGVQWTTGRQLHTIEEVVASLIALMVAKMALVRYYSRPTDRFLLLGVAFLGTGLLDGYHGLAGSGVLPEIPLGLEMASQSWGWIASRLFLAIFLLGTCFASNGREDEGRLDPRLVYSGAGALILTFLLVLTFAPLPASYVSDLWIRRSLELVPAALFGVVLAVSLRRGRWRDGGFDHWLMLFLLAGFLGQALFMGFARGPRDPLVVAGHVAKILSYLCVVFGLLGDMYALFRRADRSVGELARANAALQREVRERTHAQEERNRFFDLSLDLLCIGSLDGYFRQLTPVWVKTFGWTMDELTTRPFIELVHPDDREGTKSQMQRLRLGGTVVDFENRFATSDGHWRWLSWRSVAMIEKGLIYAAARDISERKRIEQMKNDFVSVVSHELRTPLTSIRGSLGLIAGGVAGELPEKVRTLVDIAAKNSDRLVRLINDILDVEKIESGQMGFRLVPQELDPIVEQAVEANQTYGEPYGITLRIVETGRILVRADADRIQQVLSNLLSNAVKFSPRGGVVEVGVTAQGGRARIRVTDHGKGIPPEFQLRIFEKFAQADATSTRQQGGTGLGLSISKAIVERHGGEIWFETAPGKGTTFFVELPEWLAETAPGAAAERRERILVCEDDRDIAKLLVLMLQQDGFEVDIAYDAADARRCLSQKSYAAMTLDLMLPDEDGITLLRELRQDEAGRRLPVVVVSARAEDGQAELDGGAIGVIDWLVKPIDQERLTDSVRRAVHGALNGRPCILHVEDDPDLQRVVEAIVERDVQVERAGDLAEARYKLGRQRFDLVILDLGLPDGSGMDLLPHLGALSPPTPVIIFSAHEVDTPIASQVASVLVKSHVSNRELLEKIQGVLGKPWTPEVTPP